MKRYSLWELHKWWPRQCLLGKHQLSRNRPDSEYILRQSRPHGWGPSHDSKLRVKIWVEISHWLAIIMCMRLMPAPRMWCLRTSKVFPRTHHGKITSIPLISKWRGPTFLLPCIKCFLDAPRRRRQSSECAWSSIAFGMPREMRFSRTGEHPRSSKYFHTVLNNWPEWTFLGQNHGMKRPSFFFPGRNSRGNYVCHWWA